MKFLQITTFFSVCFTFVLAASDLSAQEPCDETGLAQNFEKSQQFALEADTFRSDRKYEEMKDAYFKAAKNAEAAFEKCPRESGSWVLAFSGMLYISSGRCELAPKYFKQYLSLKETKKSIPDPKKKGEQFVISHASIKDKLDRLDEEDCDVLVQVECDGGPAPISVKGDALVPKTTACGKSERLPTGRTYTFLPEGDNVEPKPVEKEVRGFEPIKVTININIIQPDPKEEDTDVADKVVITPPPTKESKKGTPFLVTGGIVTGFGLAAIGIGFPLGLSAQSNDSLSQVARSDRAWAADTLIVTGTAISAVGVGILAVGLVRRSKSPKEGALLHSPRLGVSPRAVSLELRF